jgi:anti-sigma B factor antagonist
VPVERYPVERAGDLAVVALPEEVDISTADLLRDELLSVIDEGAAVVVVDMSLTAFCDSAALSALIIAHKRAAAAAAELRLAAASAAVLRVLKITGVDRLISLYPTVAAARAGRPAAVQPAGRPAAVRPAAAE